MLFQSQISLARDYVVHLVKIMALASLLATAITLAFPQFWLGDLFANFPIPLGFGLLLGALTFGLCERYWPAFLCVIFASFQLLVIFPYFSVDATEHTRDLPVSLRVYTLNAHDHNTHHAQTVEAIANSNATIVGSQEVDDQFQQDVKKIHAIYPYQYWLARDDGFGLAFLSKNPFMQKKIAWVGKNPGIQPVPFMSISVKIQNKLVKLLNVHLQRPLFPEEFKTRTQELAKLTNYLTKNAVSKKIT